MQYEFSLGSFFFGIMIVIAGVLLVRFHAWFADNFAGGVGSYEKFKLGGVITIVIGMLVTFNLHVLVLVPIARAIFPPINS